MVQSQRIEVKVHMMAFGKPGEIRLVDVPKEEMDGTVESQLERVFIWGQNDFQPKQHCSVSVGDVIELNDERWLVSSVGFRKLTEEEFESWNKMDRRDRAFG